MELKGITSPPVTGQPSLQVRQIKPGEVENVKKIAQDNDLDELIIENDKGSFLVSGSALTVQKEFIDDEGLKHVTNLTRPDVAAFVGDKVQFGELKGKLIYRNQGDEKQSAVIGLTGGVGMMVGGVIGYNRSTYWQVFDKVVAGAIPKAAIGTVAGFALGAGIAYLAIKPKTTGNHAFEPYLMPRPESQKTPAESHKL